MTSKAAASLACGSGVVEAARRLAAGPAAAHLKGRPPCCSPGGTGAQAPDDRPDDVQGGSAFRPWRRCGGGRLSHRHPLPSAFTVIVLHAVCADFQSDGPGRRSAVRGRCGSGGVRPAGARCALPPMRAGSGRVACRHDAVCAAEGAISPTQARHTTCAPGTARCGRCVACAGLRRRRGPSFRPRGRGASPLAGRFAAARSAPAAPLVRPSSC